jgi:diaminopropionate ammonia-lyase
MTTDRGVLRNPLLDRAAITPRTGSFRSFHESLPGYSATRLVSAPQLARRLGVATVHVKDESSRLGLPSFKILGASWATFRVLAARAGVRAEDVENLDGLRKILDGTNVVLVAATDGNHGRAIARMAALLNLKAHILVPQDMTGARVDSLRAEGARVTIVDGTYDDAVTQSAALADDQHVVVSDTSWDGYESVPGWVIDGYATITEETLAELAETGNSLPTIVAVQIGVGAFAASIVRSFVPLGARVIGVEPTKAACLLESARAGRPVQIDGPLNSIMAGLNCGTPSRVAWPVVSAGIESFVAVSDADAEEAMRALADTRVVAGESGAAGLAGLLSFGPQLDLRPDDHVLVVCTEGDTDPVAYQRIVGTRPACQAG